MFTAIQCRGTSGDRRRIIWTNRPRYSASDVGVSWPIPRRPPIDFSEHVITSVSALSAAERCSHGYGSRIAPSQYRSPAASTHGVKKNGMLQDTRIASRIRIDGVVSALNHATVPRVTFVAVIPNRTPGRADARSANVHAEQPGSHVSRKRPNTANPSSPEFTPHVVM